MISYNDFGRLRITNVKAYDTLITPPEPTLIPNITTRVQASTVFIEAFTERGIVGEGSGFLVAVEPPNTYVADIFLVTARHNVYGAIGRGASVRILFSTLGGGDAAPHTVPNATWTHGAHDVSVALLDLDALPPHLDARALDSRVLSFSFPYNGGTLPILLYGRGRVGIDKPLLVRSASVMTNQQPRVVLEGLSGPMHVWVAEGLVTRGMSGGPAATVTDGVWLTSILGLIHGYACGERHAPAPYTIRNTEVADLREELLREVDSLRQGLLFIVPSMVIRDEIKQCLHQAYSRRVEIASDIP